MLQQPCQNAQHSDQDNIYIQIQTDDTSLHSRSDRYNKNTDSDIPPVQNTLVRYMLFFCCMLILVMGRYSVPENDPPCLVDKVMDMLGSANEYVLTHPMLRDVMQITCSGFMDIMALATFFHWVHYQKTSRFILSAGLFYGIRTLTQKMFFLPFPPGYWWNNPGFPSLVVPYGRGSDFFFSGHSGFIVICLNEWLRANNMYMVAFIALGGIYTMFVLILFRIHYSIDILAGVIIAHWCFLVVDMNKQKIDQVMNSILSMSLISKDESNKNDIKQILLTKPNKSSRTDIELQNYERREH